MDRIPAEKPVRAGNLARETIFQHHNNFLYLFCSKDSERSFKIHHNLLRKTIIFLFFKRTHGTLIFELETFPHRKIHVNHKTHFPGSFYNQQRKKLNAQIASAGLLVSGKIKCYIIDAKFYALVFSSLPEFHSTMAHCSLFLSLTAWKIACTFTLG